MSQPAGKRDLTDYRNTAREQERIRSLLELTPDPPGTLLDIGSRDGYLASTFADAGWKVTALDLQRPEIEDQRIECVTGDATRLQFEDNSFDVVLCAEVLEHIPLPGLEQAASEIARVASRAAIIGVPYRQDLRLNRTRCSSCGASNPPWGHVNSFDETTLAYLMRPMEVGSIDYIGSAKEFTNFVSAGLMRFAGYPYGTYMQEEECVICGGEIGKPPPRNLLQKVATRLALVLDNTQRMIRPARPLWMHMVFHKPCPPST